MKNLDRNHLLRNDCDTVFFACFIENDDDSNLSPHSRDDPADFY
jgi:hypothetical protein